MNNIKKLVQNKYKYKIFKIFKKVLKKVLTNIKKIEYNKEELRKEIK